MFKIKNKFQPITGSDIFVSGFVEDQANVHKKLILGDDDRAIQVSLEVQ